MPIITQEKLKECLTYNTKTGDFVWRERPLNHFKRSPIQKSWNTKHAGRKAGRLNNRYVSISIDKKGYLAHRLAFLFMTGKFPIVGDHIDGDTRNNAWSNLREVDYSGNSQNQRKAARHNKYCTMLGVSYIEKSKNYLSRIVVKKKLIRIGLFDSELEAHNAYVDAKRLLHSTCTI